jgi:hypothetical protein
VTKLKKTTAVYSLNNFTNFHESHATFSKTNGIFILMDKRDCPIKFTLSENRDKVFT